MTSPTDQSSTYHSSYTSPYGTTYEYDVPVELAPSEQDSWTQSVWKGLKRNKVAQEQLGWDQPRAKTKVDNDEATGLLMSEVCTLL